MSEPFGPIRNNRSPFRVAMRILRKSLETNGFTHLIRLFLRR